MPAYRYLGPKVLRRQSVPASEPPPPTHTEVKPGDVVHDLTEAELTAFGDRFELVEDAAAHATTEHQAAARRTTHA